MRSRSCQGPSLTTRPIQGFTVVEMLAVPVVLGILMALVAAAVQNGHVEGNSLSLLFSDEDDAALSLWNRDDQPHRERLDR